MAKKLRYHTDLSRSLEALLRVLRWRNADPLPLESNLHVCAAASAFCRHTMKVPITFSRLEALLRVLSLPTVQEKQSLKQHSGKIPENEI